MPGPPCDRSGFCYRNGRRLRRTVISWPVFFKLPIFPTDPILTSNSNSPPIVSLHATQTSVSGITRRRAGGIGVPQRRQLRDSLSIITTPSKTSTPGVAKGPGTCPRPSIIQNLLLVSLRSTTRKITQTHIKSHPGTTIGGVFNLRSIPKFEIDSEFRGGRCPPAQCYWRQF